MSREIDERVVSMQFDNQHFEKNVQTSLSTLDKLKQKLNLTGASKGLENVGAAAKKVDFAPLGNAAQAVGAKFSAMEVMGITALANITNSAVNAGKRIVSALTIDPVKTGFQEYETQINAVQTILANTQSKGTTIDDVNKALDELNTYADKTIYNFTEMTRNIGTFTAAGVGLDQSVSAIQGIANLAAVSGSTSQQASTAMYQLSQALAAGRVSLMDWNSVVNAGMGGQVFQDALKRTSEVMGTGAEAAIKKYGSFRESLTQGEWLTTDVLTETLKQFTMAAEEGTTQWEKYKASLMEQGYTEKQAIEILKMANTATDAATKVKTFTQLWDVLKESAQSGWAQTWKLIVGDFEEAKSLLTPISDALTGIINKMSNWRNSIVESALGKNFSKLSKDLKTFTNPLSKTVDTVKDAATAVKDLGDIVDKVINGDFGNGQIRFDALTKAGYNWCEVQNKVNEKLGDGHRYTKEQIDAQNKLLGTQKKTTDATSESTEAQKELTKENIKRLATLTEMSDAELESLGYTKDQIKAFKELAEVSHKLGIPIEELLENLDEINGRWLLWEGVKNIGNILVDTFKVLGAAVRGAFGPMKTVEQIGSSIFDGLAAFHKFTRSIVLIDDETGQLTKTGENLLKTFRGIFTIVRLVSDVVGGALKFAFKVVSAVLEHFDMDILDLTAKIGDIIWEFGEWVDQVVNLDGIIKAVVPYIIDAAKAVGNFIDKVKGSDAFNDFIQGIRETIGAVTDWIAGIKDAENIPEYIISGLVNGLRNAGSKVWNAGVELATKLWEAFCNFMGIQSPSRRMEEAGGYVGEGLWIGIKNFFANWWGNLKNICEGIVNIFKSIDWTPVVKLWNGGLDGIKAAVTGILDFFKDIDWGGIITVATIAGLLKIAFDITTAIKNISAGFEGFGDLCESLGKGFDRISKATRNLLNAKALQALATSLLMLVGAIAVLALIDDPKSVWIAISQILSLAIILGGLSVIVGKFGATEGTDFAKISLILLSVAGAIAIMALVMKLMADLTPEQLDQGYSAIGTFTLIIGALTAVATYAGKTENVAGTILKIAIAIGILGLLARMLGGMDPDALDKGINYVTGLGFIIAGLILSTRLAGKTEKITSTIMGIAGAIAIMGLTVRILGGMDPTALEQGTKMVLAFAVIIIGLIAATNLVAGARAKNIGGAIAGIASAMLMMALVVRILGGMDPDQLRRGTICVAAFAVVIAGLIWATKLAGKSHKHLATTLLAIAGAIAIMAIVAAVLGLMKPEHLIQGIAAVGALALMIAVMIAATKGAAKCVGNLIVITLAITLMAIAIGVLGNMDQAGIMTATACLMGVMGMLAILISASSNAKGALGTLIVLTAAIAVIGTVLYFLAELPWQGTLAAAAGLSLVMLALSGCLLIISKLAQPGPMALIAMGVMVLVVAAIGIVIYELAQLPVESVKGVVASLVTMLVSMTLVLAVLTLIGMAGPAALIGIGSLAALIVGIGGLIVGIGALMEKFPQLEAFLDKGIPVLEKIGHAIGSFFGNIIGGFLDGATDMLPEIGTRLSQFMVNLTPFLIGVKMVDSSVGENVKSLAQAIMWLTAADLLTQIVSFIGGGSTLPQLGTELSQFMTNAMPFIMSASLLNAEMLSGVKALAETVLILTAADILNGLTSWLTGGSSLSEFGAQLPELGTHLAAFATNLGTFDDSKVQTVSCAANAIKAIAKAAEEIPNEGGWLGKIVGENNLGEFGAQLPALGTQLAAFATNLGTFDDTKVQTVTSAANAIKGIADAAKDIPNEGGWLGKIVGENDLATFAANLPVLGTNLANFATNLGTFDEAKVATVTCAAEAIKGISTAAKDIPNEGGWMAKIAGDNDIETFGAKLPALGTDLAGFAKNLGTFDDAKVATITSAVKAISSISKLGDVNIGDLVSNMYTFGEKLPGFGEKIKGFADSMTTVSSAGIDLAVSKLLKVKDAILKLEGIDGSSAENFKKALKDLADNAVADLIKQFTSSKNAGDMKEAGGELVMKLVDGIEKKADKVKNKFKDAVKDAKNKVRDYRDDFYDAGKYLASGLANGISAKVDSVAKEARSMVKAAVQAAKDEADINSPSRVFRAIGTSVPEGFAQGIAKLGRLVTGSSTEMVDTAITSTKDSLTHLNDILIGDVASHPTIRPVVDLDGVMTARNAIADMLNMGSDIGVLTNVGSISTAMKRMNQNGNNDDVVSAIDKLRKGLDNVGNTTYSIGDVMVADSEVENAIQVLVNAIIRDRRS